jgi:hypothetical protein
MTGTRFEQYFAELLRHRGYRNVRVVGGAGDGGIDIIATDPGGRPIACQCKRQTANVSVQIVRQLLGSVTHEHRGRMPLLATTATLTKPAADLATRSGVQVVDRPILAGWMAEAREKLAGSGTRPDNAAEDHQRFARDVGRDPAARPACAAGATIDLRPEPSRRTRQGSAAGSPDGPARQPVTPVPGDTISGDGLFIVGVHINAGIYHSNGPTTDRGFWALLPAPDSIQVLDNGHVTGPTTITVGPLVKAVQVRGCQPWHRASTQPARLSVARPPTSPVAARLPSAAAEANSSASDTGLASAQVIAGDGLLLVGRDIRPGVYRTPGPAGGRPGSLSLRSSTSSRDLLDFVRVAGQATVMIGPEVRAVEARGCQPWQWIAADLDTL